MTLRRRWFIQISALLTLDGRVLAYHGYNGYGGLGFDSGEGAAGAQITQSRHEEVVTINNNAGLFKSCNWNEYNLKSLTRDVISCEKFREGANNL